MINTSKLVFMIVIFIKLIELNMNKTKSFNSNIKLQSAFYIEYSMQITTIGLSFYRLK